MNELTYSPDATTLYQGPARDTLIQDPYRFSLPAETDILAVLKEPYRPLVAFEDVNTGPVLLDPWAGVEKIVDPSVQETPLDARTINIPPSIPLDKVPVASMPPEGTPVTTSKPGLFDWIKENPIKAGLIGFGIYLLFTSKTKE